MFSYCPQALERAEPSVVLLHGGGNFGTIWPATQLFRERVVQNHITLPIVQLAQSIHFESNESLSESREILSSHPNFTLLARDAYSYRFATERLGLRVLRTPDMATYLRLEPSQRDPQTPIVWMGRTDGEAALGKPMTSEDVEIIDWLTGDPYRPNLSRFLPPITVRTRGIYNELNRRYKSTRIPATSLRYYAYKSLASMRLNRGLSVLAFGEIVVTDRLHGHILCSLIKKPHIVIDTRHSKIGHYIATHGSGPSLLTMASSVSEALSTARDFVAQ